MAIAKGTIHRQSIFVYAILLSLPSILGIERPQRVFKFGGTSEGFLVRRAAQTCGRGKGVSNPGESDGRRCYCDH